MNQVAHKPPSRMGKEDLRNALANADAEKAKLAESARLLGEENARMLQELAVVRARQAAMAPNSTTTIAQREIDPVTGKFLNPALSEEDLAAQDAQLASMYEDQMAVPGTEIPPPIKAIETNRAASLAKNTIHTIRPSMETDERDTGFHGKVQQFLDTPVGEEPKLVEFAREVDVLAAEKKQSNIDFMKQLVTVHIHMTTDRFADKIFSIGVNGRQWSFERNKEYTVPRYVVEGLLRAKPMTYGNDEITKSNGERTVVHPIQQGCRYPFAIVEDRYPNWKRWMAYTMAQPD